MSRFPGPGDLPGDNTNPNSPDFDNEQAERDDEAATAALDLIRNHPAILRETWLDDDELAAAGAALAPETPEGDIEFVRIWRGARDRYIEELIETEMLEHGHADRRRAAENLARIYA